MKSDSLVELLACPLCDSARFERVATPRTWLGKQCFAHVANDLALSRCSECGFVFVNPRPAETLVRSFYRDGTDYDCHDVTMHRDPSVRLNFVLDLIESFRPLGYQGRLLDFGCGAGSFVEGAIERRWDAIGFDIGERARISCTVRGVPFTDSLEELKRQRFDVITLNHVFEHVYDYPSFFRLFDQVVTDDAVVYVEVPNVSSLRARLSAPALSRYLHVDERYRAFPLHLSYFGPRTLPAVFERFGYELVHRYNFGVGIDEFFTTGSGARAALDEPRATAPQRAKPVVRLAKSAVKKSLFALNLGENLAVVVRKSASVTWTELANGCVLASCDE